MPQTQTLLLIEFTVLAVLLAVWLVKRRMDRRPARSREAPGRGRLLRPDPDRKRHGSALPVQRMPTALSGQNVPIPWGWPRSGRYRGRWSNASVSELLRLLFERLVRKKQLVSDRRMDPRVANSLRALLEDRYHPVGRDRMTEIAYHLVKRPLLRDPSEPPDQMDDFGRQQGIMDGKRLNGVGAVESIRPANGPAPAVKQPRVVELRRPWGW